MASIVWTMERVNCSYQTTRRIAIRTKNLPNSGVILPYPLPIAVIPLWTTSLILYFPTGALSPWTPTWLLYFPIGGSAPRPPPHCYIDTGQYSASLLLNKKWYLQTIERVILRNLSSMNFNHNSVITKLLYTLVLWTTLGWASKPTAMWMDGLILSI